MQGYWGDAELTSRSYRPHGPIGQRLLYTGDVFRRDEDGRLYFLGRRDDMIKRGAERISPREIENVLCQMDAVQEAAVAGVPDEILGQSILAFVARKGDTPLRVQDVLQHCTAHMESFMVPKRVVILDRLPKTANGKIDKKALLAEHGQTDGRA
jgi:acyl-coenzyme A synthetase/AMP-(fatty) acid ligase